MELESKNKIALCLSGYFDSFTDLTSKGVDGFEHIKKHILSQNNGDIDIFIHSWDISNQLKIEMLYGDKIKKQVFEPQINFLPVCIENKLNTIKLHSAYSPPQNILSHFYSVQKSHELMSLYEIENNFEYDIVIKSRFDLGRINRNTSGPGLFNPYPVQCINFNPLLDMSKIYMANWQFTEDEGVADMWFYSNSKNMKNFCNLYEIMKMDLIPNGDYRNFVPSEEQLCNAIRMYKWFFIKTGLWDKKILLETFWE